MNESTTVADTAAAAREFEAALREVKSVLDTRRLMFVLVNVLLPALAVAIPEALSGGATPGGAWLARAAVPLVGAVLAAVSALVCLVLMRCHYGLVLNGAKMQAAATGRVMIAPLNWLGVTTNFVALAALSAGAGLALLLLSWTGGTAAPAGGAAGGAGLFLLLWGTHRRANATVRRLGPSWQAAGAAPLSASHGDERGATPPTPTREPAGSPLKGGGGVGAGGVSEALRERHRMLSLEATAQDQAVVVTMAAALFAGFFAAMSKIGSIPDDPALGAAAAQVRLHGVAAGSGYLALSLVCSARMLIRLRVAVGEHSAALAVLRREPDRPWDFHPLEKSFLLYLVVLTLASAAAVLAARALGGTPWALRTGALLFLAGVIVYRGALARAARAHAPARAPGA